MAEKEEQSAAQCAKQVFQANFEYEKRKKPGYLRRRWDDFNFKDQLHQWFPCIDWMQEYNLKVDGPCDLIAGITVGIMHIPQGLGYALLAQVPPVVGMYMAFYPQLFYTFLGSSRHNSMGTFAVITLLVGKSVASFANNPDYVREVTREINGTMVTQMEQYTSLEVGTTTTFISGLWQMLLFLLNLGKVTELMSDAFVNSFIAGAGIHIFTSQVKEIVGVQIPYYTGEFNLLKVWRDLFLKIWESDAEGWTTIGVAVIISTACFALLSLTVLVIRPRLLKITRVPFPAELILLVGGVYLATGLELKKNYGTIDIGEIPIGLPAPTLPNYELIEKPLILLQSFVTGFVSYSITISMGIILAQGRNYVVDNNQELLALSLGNLFSCHYSCVAYGASLSRSMVLNDVGGATQLTGLTAAGLIVLVLLFIADFFEPLPRAVLACIITVALREIFLQVLDLPKFWRRSKLDGMVWIIVFLIVVIVDVDIGLAIGFIISAAVIFFQGLGGNLKTLGKVDGTDLYFDVNNYKTAHEVEGIKILAYRGVLNFATRDNFKVDLLKGVGINPIKEAKRLRKLAKRQEKTKKGQDNQAFEIEMHDVGVPRVEQATNISWIVVDLSAMTNIDPNGADKIKALNTEYRKVNINLCVAGPTDSAYEKMQRWGISEGENGVRVFPTVSEAVTTIQREREVSPPGALRL